MTETQLKAKIQEELNRTDLDSKIDTALDLAVKKLERHCLWFQLTSTTVATVAATGYASLPTSFIKEVKDGFTDTDADPLTKESLATIINWQTSLGSSDEPAWYAIGDKFYFYPIPDAIYALPLRYYKYVGMPGDALENIWTGDLWDLAYWACLEEMWRYLRNTDLWAQAKDQKLLLLKDAKALSGQLTGRGTMRYVEY